jgi:hypothetical protein
LAQSITIRLTPERARFIKLIKKRFNFKKNSEAIDLVSNVHYFGGFALVNSDAIMTFDPTYYKNYFPQLTILD